MTIELVVINAQQQSQKVSLQAGGSLKIESGDSLKLDSKINIKKLRKGNDLIINIDGEEYILSGFFVISEAGELKQTFSWTDPLDQLYTLNSTDTIDTDISNTNVENGINTKIAIEDNNAAATEAKEDDDDDRALAWLFNGDGKGFGPLAVLGGILATGAAVASGSGGGGGSDERTETTTTSPPPAAPTLNIDNTDADGRINVSGKADPGSTVTVTWPDGSTSTTITDSNGNWNAQSPTVQQSGNVMATATEVNGKQSNSSTVTYTDITPPNQVITITGIGTSDGFKNDFVTVDDGGLFIHASLDKPLNPGEVLQYFNGTTWRDVDPLTEMPDTMHIELFDAGLTSTITIQFRIYDGAQYGTPVSRLITIDPAPNNPIGVVTDSDAAGNTVNENEAADTVVGITALATDSDGDSVTYSLDDDAGGRFKIDPDSGVVSVADGSLLNYETATSHTIKVRAASADTSFSTAEMTINIQDVTESASFTLTGVADSSVDENSAYAAAAPGISGSPIGSVTYTLGGDDAALFTVNPLTGAVSMTAQDFEGPLDANADGVYHYTLIATDADNNTNSEDVTVTLNDVVESASFTLTGVADSSVDENSTYAAAAPGISGSPIGSVTYTLGGDDAALFTVNPLTGAVSMTAQDFEGPLDANADGVYHYTLIATDADNNTTSEDVTVTVNDVGLPIYLSAIASGVGGFVINGQAINDYSGYSVSSAGDVNGDGLADVIIGAIGNDAILTDAGRSYVVFGKSDVAAIDLSNIANGIGGFAINGQASGDISGVSVSSAGDVNGDGLADLIVGANLNDFTATDAGRSYVVFGKTDTASVNLSAVAAGTGGFVINGQANQDWSGMSVSSAGDMNGDGLTDLLIGAALADTGGIGGVANQGSTYVVYGKTSTGAINLSAVAAGSGGFIINGQANGNVSGNSVSSAGDVNGDGISDLIIGAYNSITAAGSSTGRSYVVFGKTDNTTPINLSAVAAGSGGFLINGQAANDFSGVSVSSAGDVNGDGLADLIVGADRSDPAAGSEAGRSYIVFGKTDTATIELSNIANGIGGFVINAEASGDFLGSSVSSIGDFNGDGLADVLIGAPRADLAAVGDVGRSYVIFGKTDTAAVNVADIVPGDSTNGIVIIGQANVDYSGNSVSSAGDVNGDGLVDLIVGAFYNNTAAGADAGRSYIIFGGTQWLSNYMQGSGTVTGTAAAETVVGASGDDVLIGGGGIDRFYAGAGNDVITLSSSDVANLMSNAVVNEQQARIDGGTGIDTIRLTEGLTLDLTQITNTAAAGDYGTSSRIANVERFDLATDTAANTLTIGLQDVMEMAGMNLFNDANGWTGLGATVKRHQVIVDGTAADTVNLRATEGWTLAGTVTNGSNNYSIYNNGTHAGQLLIDNTVNILFA